MTRRVQVKRFSLTHCARDMAGASEKDSIYSWLYLGVVMLVVIPVIGFQDSFGILVPVFIEYFDENNSRVGWVGSISFLVDASIYIPIIFIRRHFSIRLILSCASILLVVAFLSTPFMPTLNYLYLSYSVPFGISNGCVNYITIITLYEVFDQYIGFAVGLRFMATSIGAMLWSYVLPVLFESLGWRQTFAVLSSISVACILLAVMYKRPVSKEKFEKLLTKDERDKENEEMRDLSLHTLKKLNWLNSDRNTNFKDSKENDLPKDVYGDGNSKKTEEFSENDHCCGHTGRCEGKVTEGRKNRYRNFDGNMRKVMEKDITSEKEHDGEMIKKENYASRITIPDKQWGSYGFLRNKWFLLKLLGYLLTASTISVPPIFIVQYSKTLGHPLSKSKWLLFTRGISMLITRLFFSCTGDILLKHRKVFWVMTAVVTFFGISTGLCSLTQSHPLMLSYMAFFGSLEGLYWMFLPLQATEMFSEQKMEECFSCLNLTCGIGYLLGPPLAGWLFDSTGDFRKVLYATSACGLVAAGLISLDVCVKSPPKNVTEHVKTINSDGFMRQTGTERSETTEERKTEVVLDMIKFQVVERETCV